MYLPSGHDSSSRWSAAPAERFRSAVVEALVELSAKDLRSIAISSGATVQDSGLRIPILTRTSVVNAEEGTVRWEDGTELEDDLKIVLLHYVLGSAGNLEGKWRSFQETESGALYYSVFQRRALNALLTEFEHDIPGFSAASAKLGGKKVERGSASFDFSVFPFLRMNVTIWEGDDEVPASANILFDFISNKFLGAEDLAHLAEWLVETLIRSS